MSKPKVLLIDIETAPLIGFLWGLWDQTLGLDQIKQDWHVLSWSAKWLGDPPSKIMYMDQRNEKDITNDKRILKKIWQLLDDSDVVISQNGRAFDHKKLNARFILHGMNPPSTFKIVDTLILAKKHFAFTSNKLAYMSDKLCKKYKKLKPKKFPGFEMWLQCMAGNKAAWKEMEIYNKHDVLALEELYYKLIPWDSSLNLNVDHDSEEIVCTCGSKEFVSKGYAYSTTGKFKRYICKSCGKETRGRQNLFSKDKKNSLRMGTSRS